MTNDQYSEFIEEVFITSIRSVLIVDDDFPTYNEILTEVNGSDSRAPVHNDKAWRNSPDRIANLIETFRRRPRPLLVDIHDGTNVTTDEEVTTAPHLHQCDLLVLDYELDKSKSNDGTLAIEILRALMSNSHFNLVVIYTNEDLDIVSDAVRRGLISPSGQHLSEDCINEARALIDKGEEEVDNFEWDLSNSIDSAQYFYSRQNRNNFLDTMMAKKQPYSSYSNHANRVNWQPEQRKLVLKYLLMEAERKFGIDSDSSRRFDLDWSRKDFKWIKSNSAFVALSKKTGINDDLLSELKNALVDWNPRPSRLLLTKLRTEIDEYGVAAETTALQNHQALAYWYYHLLRASETDEGRWQIAENVARHATRLMEVIQPRVEEFAFRLIRSEIQSGKPKDICKKHFGIDLNNDKQKKDATLEHNASVCSMEPLGWHLTTGHVFRMSNEYWICLSPACDMVPSQLRPWKLCKFGELLPFIGVNLKNVKPDKALEDVQSNRFVFFRVDGSVLSYCLNDPSASGSTPTWQLLFAENRGRFNGGGFQFKVACIQQGETGLVSKCKDAEVVSQVRYEYALNYIQKLGVSLTRVGLGFSSGVTD